MSRHREDEAFGASRARLVALARRVHATDEAEDVVQEVLSRLLERGAEDVRSAEAWLTTSVRNAAIDARRRASLQRRVADLLAADVPVAEFPGSDLDGEIDELVGALVATFGTATAAALLLRFALDVPYEELARDSGRTSVAWRQLLHRALRRLRERGLERRRLDEEETRAAAICRDALAAENPARLHALVRTTTVGRAAPRVPAAGSGHEHAEPMLALVNGRYVLALVMDGHVLCALPVGATEDVDSASACER